ncbi:hypothetical protein HH303_12085 [Rhodospirillaceae bacterium KN72]|uniref:Hemin receptor n=1 Tax=Pacificispira spongiicola TaxID=2729598 RepID=A0A7Y0E0X9_9PROT|nr:hypothetical protein [Pacificispira spongiicola]NMM45223.1 hypothetical protein [Pacificispira spongiicola]
MNNRPYVPPEIGPHERRELELMLKGIKPLAMFADVVSPSFHWPDAKFEPHVRSGRIIKREYLKETLDGKYTFRELYYALPNEVWRIERAHELSNLHFDHWSEAVPKICAEMGKLLGYSDHEIAVFLEWSERKRMER